MGENALAIVVIVGLISITAIPFIMVVIGNYMEAAPSPMQTPPNMAAGWPLGDADMNPIFKAARTMQGDHAFT